MELTYPHVRTQVMMALHAWWDIDGRTDDEACLIFDNMSATLECTSGIAEVGGEEAIGEYLVSVAERKALVIWCSYLEKLNLFTNRGSDEEYLGHPFYHEMAYASRLAFDAMAMASPDGANANPNLAVPLEAPGKRPAIMAALIVLWDLQSSTHGSRERYVAYAAEVTELRASLAGEAPPAVGDYLFCLDEAEALRTVLSKVDDYSRRLEKRGRLQPSKDRHYAEVGEAAWVAFDVMALAVSETKVPNFEW